MQFKDIFGQTGIKERLINSVKENRVSHAQLFLGPEGSGKLALALAYAQYISCTDKKNDDSCGVCSSCIKYNKLIHPDLHFFFPIAATKKITKPTSKAFAAEWREFLIKNNYYIAIENWFEFIGIENKQAIINKDDCLDIIKTLNLKSFESDYKIIIIYMVEKLYHAAAPKLLKVLEEPPEKTLFILISENHDQVLTTILSRTQLIKINKKSNTEISNYLQKNNGLESQEASKIAKIANGNLSEALRILENADESNFNFENFKNWMRSCYAKDYAAIILWIEEMSKASVGREKLKRFFIYALKSSRSCLLINNTKSEDLLKLTQEEIVFLKKFAPFINTKNVFQIVEELNKTLYHIERNLNPKIVLMDVSFNLMKLLKS